MNPSMSFQADGGWPAQGRDAEHSQLPVAHGRPAGAGGHCQCVQGPEQGRTQPWPPRHLMPGKLLAQSAPSGHPGWGVAGQRPLDFAYTLWGQGTAGVSRGMGPCRGPLAGASVGHIGTGERGEDTKPPLGDDSASGSRRGGELGLCGLSCLQRCVAHETHCAISSEMLKPTDQAPVPALPPAPGSAGCCCHYCRL